MGSEGEGGGVRLIRRVGSVGAVSYSTNPLTLSPQIVFVGEIVSVSESQTNVVYKVDDRTGPLVNVKKWLDNLEAEAELNQRADCRLFTCVSEGGVCANRCEKGYHIALPARCF